MVASNWKATAHTTSRGQATAPPGLPGLALLDPAEEAGGVRLVAVEELDVLGNGGPVAFLLLEALAEGGLDVVELGPVLLSGPLGRPAPAQQLVLGLGRRSAGRMMGPKWVRTRWAGLRSANRRRLAGQVAVEVGRRRGRAEYAGRGQQHPDAVAGEQRSLVGLEHRQVVLGVPGAWRAPGGAAQVDHLAVLGRLDHGRFRPG